MKHAWQKWRECRPSGRRSASECWRSCPNVSASPIWRASCARCARRPGRGAQPNRTKRGEPSWTARRHPSQHQRRSGSGRRLRRRRSAPHSPPLHRLRHRAAARLPSRTARHRSRQGLLPSHPKQWNFGRAERRWMIQKTLAYGRSERCWSGDNCRAKPFRRSSRKLCVSRRRCCTLRRCRRWCGASGEVLSANSMRHGKAFRGHPRKPASNTRDARLKIDRENNNSKTN